MNSPQAIALRGHKPRVNLAALLALLLMAATPATGDGDEAARISPVRRTTIATADVDASLHFYRDLLGFTVEYDVRVTNAD